MRWLWRNDEPPWMEAVAWPLSLASLGYRAGAALHRATARRVRATVPVISVGNVTAGGAGKTPVVLWIAQNAGKRAVVLSRGYGRRSREVIEVTPQTPARDVGDEPLLLARRGVRVIVGADRARIALGVRDADLIVLDDGLQHHALERDLDVIVVDGSNPFGNGRLLPRGPLRESLPSALRRARRPLVWLTRADLPRAPDAPEAAVESAYEASADLAGKRVFLFAGLARPDSFEATVRKLGAEIAGTRWFPDHHWYTPAEIDAMRGPHLLVTTEKDAARLDDLTGITVVRVDVKILRGEDAAREALK